MARDINDLSFDSETSFLTTIAFNSEPESESRKYANSDLVRDWLVMSALAGSGVPMNTDLDNAFGLAFNRLVEGLQTGLVQLDYAPIDRETLDIPPADHPHYMQALLYWSSRLECTTSVLVEAHARLGRSPTAENAGIATRRIEKEERLLGTWQGNAHGPHGTAETMPMFQTTEAFSKH